MTQPIRVPSVFAVLGLGAISIASILGANVSATPPYIEPSEPPTFNLSQRYARTLWDGEQSATQACMRDRGFDYTAAPFPEADDLDAGYAELHARDLVALARDGYGVARSLAPQASAPQAPEAGDSSDAPARFVEALLGPEPPAETELPAPGWEAGGDATPWYADSCRARAHRTIYGAAYPHDELRLALEQLQRELGETLSEDSAYLWALSDWSACMRERGHLADRPLDLARALRDAHDPRELDALETRERAVAAADAHCDARVSLGARTEAARQRAEALVRARHPELERLERELELALTRARDVSSQPAALSSGEEARVAPRG